MSQSLILTSRSQTPPVLRLTERDKRILETIHAFGGMMSLKQIDRLFFAGQGRSQPRARMRMLHTNGYINMPAYHDRHKVPFGETIYWLTSKGASIVAALRGVSVNQFTWQKQPRWSLISHDLVVNEFRMNVITAVHHNLSLTLNQWIPEHEFWAHPDKVEYTDTDGKTKSRFIRPDGFFSIRRNNPHNPGRVEEFAFLLEIDMSTEDNPRFVREKVRPGIAYLRSQAFQDRFGLKYGRWLIITTGGRRLANMKTQAEQAGGNGLFYFTTFDRISTETILTRPIWYLTGGSVAISIIPTFNVNPTSVTLD